MTYEVQQTRWDRLIRRVSGSIGPGSRVSETISELFPVLDVESVPSELLALSTTQLGWGRLLVPAVAGQNARGQFFNPAGSGKLITITSIYLSNSPGTTVVFEFGILQVALASVSAVPQFRDSRFGVTDRPVVELRQDSNVGATPALWRFRLNGPESRPILDPNDVVVLSPGFGLVISSGTVNSNFDMSGMWRERTADQAELSF